MESKPVLNFSQVQPLVDIEFWLWFTKQKLDVWKLECPITDVPAFVSMPLSPKVGSNIMVKSPD